jgi:hypothetical protein
LADPDLSGFRATLACVDPRTRDGSFAGRDYDAQLVADPPDGVDPCESDELHTFVTAGPLARPAGCPPSRRRRA